MALVYKANVNFYIFKHSDAADKLLVQRLKIKG